MPAIKDVFLKGHDLCVLGECFWAITNRWKGGWDPECIYLFGEVGSKIVFVIFTKLFNLYDDESASPI